MLNASPQEIYLTKYDPLFPKDPSPFPSPLAKFHRLFQNSIGFFQTPLSSSKPKDGAKRYCPKEKEKGPLKKKLR